MLTLIKNYSDENKTQKRINVKKIISLNELVNTQISNITFKINDYQDFKKLGQLSTKDGETEVSIHLEKADQKMFFKLKNKRNINNKLLNSLDLKENVIFD